MSLRRKHKGTRDHCDPNSQLRKSKSIRFLQCSMCEATSGVASDGQVKGNGNELSRNVDPKPSQCSGVSLLDHRVGYRAKRGVTDPEVEFSLKCSLN